MHPYQQFVNEQSKGNPSLETLRRFLTDREKQRFRCRIGVLEFYNETSRPRYSEVSLEVLQNCIEDTVKEVDKAHIFTNPDEKTTDKDGLASSSAGRIIIVEDLNSDLINTLGIHLAIDPLFFASHLHTPEISLTSQAPAYAHLASRTRCSNFINLHYHRVISLLQAPKLPKKSLRLSNVQRKVVTLPFTQGHYPALAQHCCSVLEVSPTNGQWLGTCSLSMEHCVNCAKLIYAGLILTDPPISDRFRFKDAHESNAQQVHQPWSLLFGGYEDFLPPTIAKSPIRYQPPDRKALLEDLVYYWQREDVPIFDWRCQPSVSLAFFPLKIVAAEWNTYTLILRGSIREFEYRNRKGSSPLEQVDRLNSNLEILQTWRRRSLSSRQKLEGILRWIEVQEEERGINNYSSAVREDYQQITHRLDNGGKLLENMLPVMTSIIQIVDSRRSLAETVSVTRLTALAFIFAPMSFVATMFSMTENFGPGGSQFWIFFAVALPLTLIIYLIARPPRNGSLMLRAILRDAYQHIFKSQVNQKLDDV